ncbi:MAG: single-stranded DNA-binding protein [Spirochaetes bacterium]|nr:single-stranded DNA-binding protein [Spirochaetota bacterium]
MYNYQTVTIEGNATRSPEMKKTKTGKNVCHFSVAMNHYSKENADPQVSFIDVETWDKLAEVCANSVTKGRRIMVVGTLRQDRWEGQDGKKQSRIKVVGRELRFLESPKKPEPAAERKAS